MSEQFNGKFGFIPVDDECIKICAKNSLIIPRLYRYLGMGTYEILADVKDNPDKFFLFDVGGENGYTADDNYKMMKKLQINDTIDLNTLKRKLSIENWATIVQIKEFKDAELHEVQEHLPEKETLQEKY